MKINKFCENKVGAAPAGHFNMNGFPVMTEGKITIGMSFYLPGGGTEMLGVANECYYHIIEGQMTVTMENGEEHLLTAGDTIMFAPGDVKKTENTGLSVTRMMVISVKP